MSLFGKKEKEEIARLKAQMSPEQIQLADISAELERAKAQLQTVQQNLWQAQNDLARTRSQIIVTDEAVLMQSFGFYTPHYSYTTSEEYQKKLKTIRDEQKEMIKAGTAATGNMNWQVNGSASKGKKMVADMQKLLLRAFNAECDDATSKHVRRKSLPPQKPFPSSVQ